MFYLFIFHLSSDALFLSFSVCLSSLLSCSFFLLLSLISFWLFYLSPFTFVFLLLCINYFVVLYLSFPYLSLFLPPYILLFCLSLFSSFSLSKILYFIFIIYFYVSSFICLFHISLEIKESIQELGADNFCKRRRIFIYSSNKTSFAFIGFGKCALQLQSF